MGIISEGVGTMIEMRQKLGHTEAADTAVNGIMTDAVDMFADQFPITVGVMGIITIDITLVEFNTFLGKVDGHLKTYVQEIGPSSDSA